MKSHLDQEPVAPYLRIRPLAGGDLEFRYIDTLFELKQWRRIVPAEDGIRRLELFLEQLHWFAEPEGQAEPAGSTPGSQNS